MSARLDKSLDEIISTRRTSGAQRGRGRRHVSRAGQPGKPVAVAPVGGIKKNPKQAKPAVKSVPTGPAGRGVEGRILVSGFVSCAKVSRARTLLMLR